MDHRPSHAHLPTLVGTVGVFAVLGGAYYQLSFGVTVGLALAAGMGVVVLGLVAASGSHDPGEPAEPGDTGEHGVPDESVP